MKAKKINVALIVACITILISSCQKKDYKLDEPLDKSQIQFEVVQDFNADAGGNTVILKNNTASTVSIWDYQTGKSTRQQDTIHYAFKGDYTIKFSAVTGGGIVAVDSVKISVTENNLDYVSDPMWTNISGGAGHEKTWVLDTDGLFFEGPMAFVDPANFANVWWDAGQGIYPDNMARGDYGEMTFSLITGPDFRNIKKMENNVQEKGTYMLNLIDKTLTVNGGTILRGYKPAKNGITGISNWTTYEIVALDENTMQLGVYRDKDVDGEGLALLVYNFVSKEFAESQPAE